MVKMEDCKKLAKELGLTINHNRVRLQKYEIHRDGKNVHNGVMTLDQLMESLTQTKEQRERTRVRRIKLGLNEKGFRRK